MRSKSAAVVLVTATMLPFAAARAGVGPEVPLERSTEPVVLTGAQFPAWSAGPDPTLHEPQPPINYDTADIQPFLGPLASECYRAPSQDPEAEHPNPYDYSDNGDHNCYRPSRLPRTPRVGAEVGRILGYVWNPNALDPRTRTKGKFVQIPLQVDERFARFITNNASGFAFYSGVDKELSYAFDREPFRFTWDDYLYNGGDPCVPMPAPGPDGRPGPSTTADPVAGLDDDDEIVFMYDDARAAAPGGATLPDGLDSAFDVAVADPTDPGEVRHVYVALSTGAPHSPEPKFTAANGYVRYARDAGVPDPNDASKWLVPPSDMFAYSQSSFSGYGKAPKGAYCDPTGSVVTSPRRPGDQPSRGLTRSSDPQFVPPDPKPWAIEQRRPLDTAWVRTPRYWFRYDGRWLMTQLRISPDDSGLSANPTLGPDIIDQWKARAFQQRPGGRTPCCGYEEEVNNWGGSSMLFGERAGPVRVIRAAWGADSSTNNIKTEIFYRDEIRFQDNLRVHVIPPLDGIYVQWDYNAGKVAKYFNPWKPEGVVIDGQNDEVFGNTQWHVARDRIEFRDDDPIPGVGPQHVTVPLEGGDPNRCDGIGDLRVCNDIDLADPTFSGPAGNLNWEQVDGPNGSVVTRWTVRQHTAADAYSAIAQPYYRDDSCFDDGTGSDPGPHLRSRAVDDGASGTYVDPIDGQTKSRVCWTPADGDPYDLSIVDGRPRKFWQGDIATHGLHIQFIADSDNGQLAEPLTEIDSEQRMVVLHGDQGNVGERYGRSTELPLQVLVTRYPG